MTTTTERTGRDLWRARVTESGDRKFVRCAGEDRTFAEVDDLARRIAGGLAGLGVTLGTRVLLGMENSVETLATHIAVRELGGVLVPLMPGAAPEEHVFQVQHSGATVLIADASVADGLVPCLDRCADVATIVLGDGVAATPAGAHAFADVLDHAPHDGPDELPGLDARTPALILYTSGSTGRPKGVVLPAGSMPSAGRGYAERFGITAEDDFFLPLPMAHGVGGITAQGVALTTGCSLTIEQRFRPSRFWHQVADAGSTVSILFPAQCNLLVELGDDGPPRGASTLRLVMTHMVLPAFEERFGVELGLCWGMTETGATSVGTQPGYRGERGEGFVGHPMHGVEVAVMDTDGNHLPAGAEGEICLRHPHIMLEYLADPENTAATVIDGWVHSGDRGFVDDDGGLFYRGRFKNMIKRSGENISAEEVETVLDRHPAVAESLVMGVPDALRTEEVAAVVVVRAGFEATPEVLCEHVAGSLSRWKVPRYVVATHEPLPRLSNGKLDRQAVRASLDLASAWDRTQPGAPR